MLTSDALSIVCLTIAGLVVFIGSYNKPKRSDSSARRDVVSHDPRPDIPQLPVQPHTYPHDVSAEHRIDEIRAEVDRVLTRLNGVAPSRFGQTQRNTTRTLVENWRKSILGLIELSTKNLMAAQERFQVGDEKTAVQLACTAVENIARALIHCCGGKPDSDAGQEEVLRMLSRRFKPETKREFDNALDKLSQMLSCKPEQKLGLALEIAQTFKQITIDNFGKEIGNIVYVQTETTIPNPMKDVIQKISKSTPHREPSIERELEDVLVRHLRLWYLTHGRTA